MSILSPDIIETEQFTHVESLSQSAYQEIYLCMRTTGSEHSRYQNFKNPNLPPVEVLDCFIQLYFEYFHPAFPMLHKPTFNPHKTPWQLLLGLAAIGCQYSKAPNAEKYANALQELLRRALMDTVSALRCYSSHG